MDFFILNSITICGREPGASSVLKRKTALETECDTARHSEKRRKLSEELYAFNATDGEELLYGKQEHTASARKAEVVDDSTEGDKTSATSRELLDKIGELEAALAVSRMSESNLAVGVEHLLVKTSKLQENCERVTRDAAQHKEDAHALRERLTIVKQESEHARLEQGRLTHESTELKSGLAAEEQRCRGVWAEKTAREEDVRMLRQQLSAASSALAAATNDCQALQTANMALYRGDSELQRRCDDQETHMSQLRSELSQHESSAGLSGSSDGTTPFDQDMIDDSAIDMGIVDDMSLGFDHGDVNGEARQGEDAGFEPTDPVAFGAIEVEEPVTETRADGAASRSTFASAKPATQIRSHRLSKPVASLDILRQTKGGIDRAKSSASHASKQKLTGTVHAGRRPLSSLSDKELRAASLARAYADMQMMHQKVMDNQNASRNGQSRYCPNEHEDLAAQRKAAAAAANAQIIRQFELTKAAQARAAHNNDLCMARQVSRYEEGNLRKEECDVFTSSNGGTHLRCFVTCQAGMFCTEVRPAQLRRKNASKHILPWPVGFRQNAPDEDAMRLYGHRCLLAQIPELQAVAASIALNVAEYKKWNMRTFGSEEPPMPPKLKQDMLDEWDTVALQLCHHEPFKQACKRWASGEQSENEQRCWPPSLTTVRHMAEHGDDMAGLLANMSRLGQSSSDVDDNNKKLRVLASASTLSQKDCLWEVIEL